MKLLSFLSILSLSFLLIACSEDSNVLKSETAPKESINYLPIFEQAGWEKTYDLGDQPTDRKADQRALKCQLGDAEPFDCAGTCVGLRNYEGHNFCVGCEIDGELHGFLACTGNNIGVVFLEFLNSQPNTVIDFKILDDGDNVVTSGNGPLSTKIGEITNAMEQDESAKIEFELY